MSAPRALVPTPGVVFRHLSKRMNCCTCAPLTVSVIYDTMDQLQSDTRVCPFALAAARAKLQRVEERRTRASAERSTALSRQRETALSGDVVA